MKEYALQLNSVSSIYSLKSASEKKEKTEPILIVFPTQKVTFTIGLYQEEQALGFYFLSDQYLLVIYRFKDKTTSEKFNLNEVDEEYLLELYHHYLNQFVLNAKLTGSTIVTNEKDKTNDSKIN